MIVCTLIFYVPTGKKENKIPEKLLLILLLPIRERGVPGVVIADVPWIVVCGNGLKRL
jgi:hypothetical protein